MFEYTKRFLSAPALQDNEDKIRALRTFNAVSMSLLALTGVMFFGTIFIFEKRAATAMTVLIMVAILLISQTLARRDRISLASAVLVSAVWCAATVSIWLAGGLNTVVSGGYIALTVTAGMLLGRHAALVVAFVSAATSLGFAALPILGFHLSPYYPMRPTAALINLMYWFCLTVPAIWLALKGLDDALSAARQEAKDRAESEEALRESEEKYRNLFNNAEVGMFRTKLEGSEILDMNEKFLKIFGWTREEMRGNPSLMHWADKQEREEMVRKLNSDGQVTDFECKMLNKQGDVRVCVTSLSLDREKRLLEGSITDITDRKKTEEALRDSEERYRAVFNNVAVGINLSDTEGRFIQANSASANLFGYTEQELLRMTFYDLTHPEDREASKRQLLSLQHGEKDSYRLEKRYIRKDGQVIWADISVSALRGTEGEYISTLAVVVDITERKGAEELLQQTERRYRRLFEYAPLMYVITRNEEGVPFIGDCNEMFLRSVGYSRQEVVGQPLADFYSPESRSDLLEEGGYARALAGEFFIGERQLIKSDGTLTPTLLYTAPEIDPSGDVIGTCAMFVDITEQKKAQGALLRSEAQLSNALTLAGLGHWEYDVKKDLFTFNDHFYKLFRTSVGQVGGYTMSSADYARRFVHPDDISVLDNEIRKSIETTAPVFSGHLEHRIVYADGEIGHITVRRFVVRDDLGRVASIYGVNQDITERKKAEETLRESEQNYRSLFDSAPVGIFLSTIDGRVLSVNPAYARMYGYSSSEEVSLAINNVAECIYVEPERRKMLVDLALRTDGFVKAENQYRKKDGSLFWGQLYFRVVRDGGGKARHLQGFVEDITDRKRAEEAITRRLEFMTDLMEAIPLPVFFKDANGIYLGCNSSFAQFLGLPKESIVGKSVFDVVSRETAEIWKQKDDSLFRNPGTQAYLTSVKRYDGRTREVIFHKATYGGPDSLVSGLIGALLDVTDRKNLEQQLLQAQKMEAVGTLAGGIAHDFNNLLQVTLGYSELLLAEKSNKDPDYADLQKIHQAARSGAELVRNLLTFSRKTEPKPLPMSLNTEIRHVEKLLHRTIPRMIDIRLDLAEDVERINADPAQIEQIIMNLAVNARDAMGEEGSLTMRTEIVTLDEEYCRFNVEAKPGDYVLLSVSDTGHGMDSETLQHIFEPFYTTKELERGTGLGLAMVYGIVRQHGGHVDCYSEVGKGTTFKVYFPVIPSIEEPAVEATGIMPAFGTETVLLVDDEDLVRELGQRILTRSGYTVLTATNGEQALETYGREKQRIALVILDLIMPTMGGKDCLKKILEIDPQTKVLIASGYSADASTKEYVELGAKGFVAKPFKFKELLRQVRKALDEG